MQHSLSCDTIDKCEFFISLNLTHSCCACGCKFTFGGMSAPGHVVFIWFHFKKQHETEKEL